MRNTDNGVTATRGNFVVVPNSYQTNSLEEFKLMNIKNEGTVKNPKYPFTIAVRPIFSEEYETLWLAEFGYISDETGKPAKTEMRIHGSAAEDVFGHINIDKTKRYSEAVKEIESEIIEAIKTELFPGLTSENFSISNYNLIDEETGEQITRWSIHRSGYTATAVLFS